MKQSAPLAVTAVAWSTPLGDDLDGVWQRLLAAETGMVPVPHDARLKNDLAAPVPGEPLDRAADARMIAVGLPVLRRALAASGREASDPEVLLVLGTSLGAF